MHLRRVETGEVKVKQPWNRDFRGTKQCSLHPREMATAAPDWKWRLLSSNLASQDIMRPSYLQIENATIERCWLDCKGT